MKFIITLSWKNLTRYTRRTIITALSISIGIMMFILVDSLLTGAEKDSERNLIAYETASAQIVTRKYWDDRENLSLKDSIQKPDEVISFLEKRGIPATPRISFPGEIIVYKNPYPEDGNLQVKIDAIDPERDPKVFKLKDRITEGRWLKPEEHGLLMGKWMAEDIGAKVGYPITIFTKTRDGAYQTLDLTITGLINSENPIVNRYGLYIPIDIADEMLYMNGSASAIFLLFKSTKNFDSRLLTLSKEISSKFPDLTVVSWKELAEDYVALAETKRGGSSIILLFLFVIAAVGISNTMLMAIYERTREIGMMRAMGMKERSIGLLFIFESAIIGAVGSLVGIILSIPFVYLLVNHGINYGWLTRDFDIGYRITSIFYGAWNPTTFFKAFFMGTIIAVIVALFPVRRAFKKSIVDCLCFR